ncbi:MAG: heme-degrading domain-containing protein [Pseudomonadota bacterium]|nr:heme-degrading domain-containing protein [Pseudomonadota bacterium]
MDLEHDIDRIAQQERAITFAAFDVDSAWELGSRLRAVAQARGLALYIEIRLNHETVFACAMQHSTPANVDWARRKRNTTELMQRSSYGVGRMLERDNNTLERQMGLATRDFASHGGSFPIRVQGCGVVGTVTVSGAPQRQDHALVVEVLAGLCGVAYAELALA